MFISRGFKGRLRPTTAPERIPPGQHQVEDFPVLSAGPTPHTPLAAWDFVLVAAVAAPRRWTWAEFLARPRKPSLYLEQMRQTIQTCAWLTEEALPAQAKQDLFDLFRNWKRSGAEDGG